MNAATEERYRARFRNVLAYVDAHLNETLTVDKLSSIAAFSKYHFHRQFSALFAIGVYQYVQLCRLKRAPSGSASGKHRPSSGISHSGLPGMPPFNRCTH